MAASSSRYSQPNSRAKEKEKKKMMMMISMQMMDRYYFVFVFKKNRKQTFNKKNELITSKINRHKYYHYQFKQPSLSSCQSIPWLPSHSQACRGPLLMPLPPLQLQLVSWRWGWHLQGRHQAQLSQSWKSQIPLL